MRSVDEVADRLVYSMDTLNSPVELFSAQLDGTGVEADPLSTSITLSVASMGDAEQFTFKGWNDETVHAYVVTPADFDPTKSTRWRS